MSQLLRETNIPIIEIARRFGYHDSKNFARFFKQEMKMSPHEYRLKYEKQNE
ncbi:MAG: helix-turn-helix domain-containing protein [Planctomycetes bacterium]|nr:helix-turn-helix domain-containing protein [Planctomycetota bacterium]